MNPWLILAVLLALAGLGSWGTYENGRADKWEGKYNSLQASYKTAAVAAETHAQAVEAKQAAEIQAQSTQAIQQAQSQAQQAQNQLKSYQAKLAAAAMDKDLGHRCAGVEIPKDLIPN